MPEFISEDDLKTFDGWLHYQGFDSASMTAVTLANWRRIYEDVERQREAWPKVGLMNLRPTPGEYKYAVAVREGSELWLVLWVRCSPKGEFFVLKPISDSSANIHTSYHRDGTLHLKSYGRKVLTPQKRQSLTGQFNGTVDLGIDSGYAPRGVGAICDPSAFSGVVEVPTGVLGPVHGAIAVALVELGHPPPDYTWANEIVAQRVFCEITPNVVITIMRQKPLQR